MDIMISNMKYLGDDVDPNVLIILGFFHIHYESHSEFECPCSQNAISRVLSKVVAPLGACGEGVNTIMVPEKEIMNKEVVQDDVAMSESPIVAANQLALEIAKLDNDPALSYSDNSSDSRELPLPSNGVLKNPRR